MNKSLKTIFKYIFLLLIGGILYYSLECICRGYSHWTMILVGGICFILIGLINEIFPKSISICTQAIISSIIITIVEFISGYILNIKLGLNIWDYSDKHLNFMGQICLQNSFYWLLLSVLGIILDDYLRWIIFKEDKPKYKLF